MSELPAEVAELPAEVLRQHLAPVLLALAPDALRAFRCASRATRDDAAQWVRGLRRLPGTHPVPPDLGARFPRLTRLDLSGDSGLMGGLSLFRALQSVGHGLLSLDLGGCSGLRASFVARQLVVACPRLQHLALSCCCSAPPEAEENVFRALAAAPHLPATLTSLELRCGPAFQPELTHLAGLPAVQLLRVYGCRTVDDNAVAQLPRLLPGLRELHVGEQASRRGRHIRGEGLAALVGCSGLLRLSLGCTEPEPRRLAAALAVLTQLTELDVSGCDPVMLDSIGLLQPLAAAGGAQGDGLQVMALPAAYTLDQLARGLPQVLHAASSAAAATSTPAGPAASGAAAAAAAAVAAAAAAAAAGGQAPHPAGLQVLRLHASAQLPALVAAPLLALAGLRELRLSHCGPPPALPEAALAAAATALSSLTSLQLAQEGGADSDGMMLAGDEPGGDEGAEAAAERREQEAAADAAPPPPRRGWSWYELLPSWVSLRRLEITGADSLTDEHLHAMGTSLPLLTHFALSRSGGVSGGGGSERGFASWPAGCRCLSSVSLYDCAGIGDEALGHLAVLPALTCLALAHLPYVGPHGVRQLVAGATRLAVLTIERLAGTPAVALAELWRLPALESLSLRMCEVTNLSLQMALEPSPPPPPPAAPPAPPGRSNGVAASVAAARGSGEGTVAAVMQDWGRLTVVEASTATAAADKVEGGGAATGAPAPVARLSRLDLQGTLVTTAGLRVLGRAAGLTHLNLSHCVDVNDGFVEMLLAGRRVAGGGDEVSGRGGGGMAGEAREEGAGAAARVATSGTSSGEDGAQGGGGGGAAPLVSGAGGHAGGGGAGRVANTLPLLPCLVLVDLRGCSVSEPALARLAATGIAVNAGFGAWR
ncbi:hypothetical protein HYH02_003835 [Chlamydomonas schloesseri]|uniref:F-box domain-containing protein n=1 Tax=Chlamydomonas schloesseri TaxID=2026947 RepID=A0A835WNS8_9CHLO|nr:hypothetical protein HYH02_003835 [Chlamydomonas schloesseri]|eukprot:KAG2451228.1 hypothetical protein HYH02_003835 [Chlamydomonas schloesseri]